MPRVRETFDIDESQGPYVRYIANDVGVMYSDSWTYRHVKHKRIEDSVTPGYFRAIRNHDFLPVNTVSIGSNEEVLITPHVGNATYTHSGVDYGVTNHYGSYISDYDRGFLPVFAPSNSDIDSAVIKALAAAKAPDFDALTFLAEFRQTASLLSGTYKRFFRFTEKVARRAARREFRRSRRKRKAYDPKQALEDFSNLWLEARYGWRPLLYDIQDILKALRHKNPSGISRRSARKSVPIEVSTTTTGSIPGAVSWQTSKNQLGECHIRAVVFHKSDMSPIGMNPVLTFWEVTKYSFVIDWFIDIGGWLQAISPRVGYNQLGISVSWVVEYTEDVVTSLGSLGNWVNGYSDQHLKRYVKNYYRQAYTGVPVPSIQVNLNKLKIIDLMTLVFQHQGRMATILRL